VLKIPKSAIEPAPRLSSEQGMLLSRMANLEKEKRMIQLVDPSHLVEGEELAQIAAVAKEEHDQAPDS
jgi:purine-binding chemotaxis protein CheW